MLEIITGGCSSEYPTPDENGIVSTIACII